MGYGKDVDNCPPRRRSLRAPRRRLAGPLIEIVQQARIEDGPGPDLQARQVLGVAHLKLDVEGPARRPRPSSSDRPDGAIEPEDLLTLLSHQDRELTCAAADIEDRSLDRDPVDQSGKRRLGAANLPGWGRTVGIRVVPVLVPGP